MLEFFKEVRAELVKVIWPTKKDTFNYTVTVIVFSIAIAVILGAFDFLLLKIFETVVTR